MIHNNVIEYKFHGLDHLRSFAIISVLLFHYLTFFEHPSWFPKIIEFGWTGVDLFFVLSGFLITSQLLKKIIINGGFSMREFYIKRIFRVIPTYLFVVGIYFCIPFFREKEALPPLWKFLTFTQNFNLNTIKSGAFSHAWSLCVEEHFYLLLPIVLFFLIKVGFKYSYFILVAIFILGFKLRWDGWDAFVSVSSLTKTSNNQWMEIIYYPTYNRLDGLLIGVTIAAFYNYFPEKFKEVSKYGNMLITIGLILLSIAYLGSSKNLKLSTTIFGFPFVSISYGFLVLGAISSSSFLYKWKSKTSTLIATLSYSMYLLHKGVINMTQKICFLFEVKKDSNLVFVLSILLCLIIAYSTYLLIERPFIRLRKRFIYK